MEQIKDAIIENGYFNATFEPASLDAEENVLGGILLDPNALERVKNVLPTEAFYSKINQKIYRGMLQCYQKHGYVDLMVITTWLEDHGHLDNIGGKPKLVQLCDRTVSAVNIDKYAELIIDRWQRRKAIQVGQNISRLGMEFLGDTPGLLKAIEERVLEVTQSEYRSEESDKDYYKYQKMLERIRHIELHKDPGYREFLWQSLGTEYKRSKRQLEDIYFKSLTASECEPSMSITELKEKYGNDVNEWFLHGLLPKGTTTLLHALGGTGKTLLMYDFIAHLATGQSWGEFQTSAPSRRCLLVQTDESPGDMIRHLEDRGLDDVNLPIRHKTKWLAEHMQDLREEIEAYRPEVVVIDSLTSVNLRSTFTENETEYARPVLLFRDIAQEYGCSVVIIHHSNSEEKSRGTKAIFNSVSEVWKLSRPEGDKSNNGLDRILTIEKSRSRRPDQYSLKLNPENNSWELLGRFNEDKDVEYILNNTEQEIVNFLRRNQGVRYQVREIQETIGGDAKWIRDCCKNLKLQGLVNEAKAEARKIGKQPKVYWLSFDSSSSKSGGCDYSQYGGETSNYGGEKSNYGGFTGVTPPPNYNPLPEQDSEDFNNYGGENLQKKSNQQETKSKKSTPVTPVINNEIPESPTETEIDRFSSDHEKNPRKTPVIKNDPRKTPLKPWGTEDDLPQEEIQKHVIAYLKENGESEEYQIIVSLQQKTPEVRRALEEVAIKTCSDRWESWWKLK